MQTHADAFTIRPRYLTPTGTVEIPNRRNVHDVHGTYVGELVLINGTWTPLYSTSQPDTRTVHILTTAAASLKGAG